MYNVMKKGGKSFISVHGDGGIINDLTMKIIRPKYKNDRKFRLFIKYFIVKKTYNLEEAYTMECKKRGLSKF